MVENQGLIHLWILPMHSPDAQPFEYDSDKFYQDNKQNIMGNPLDISEATWVR